MTNLIKKAIVSVLCIGTLSLSHADSASVAETLKTRFLSSEIRLVKAQSDLPPVVVANFIGFGPNDIADSNEEYNHSDVLQGGRPSRRIVVAGIADTVSALIFDEGGIGTSRRAVLVGDVAGDLYLCEYYLGLLPDDGSVDLRALFEFRARHPEAVCQAAV